MKALLYFAPLFRPHLNRFALALVLSLVTIAAGTALLGVSGWFLTATALAGFGVSFNLFAPSAAVRGFSLIRIVSRYFEKLVGHNATLVLLSDIRRWLFGQLFPRVPLPGRTLRHGDLVSCMVADVNAVDTLFLVAIGPFLAAMIVGGVVTSVLFVLIPAAGWIYLAALSIAAVVMPLSLIAMTRRTGEALVEAMAGLRVQILDAVAGHDDIIVFGQQDAASKRFAIAGERVAALRKRQTRLIGTASALVQIVTGASLVAILAAGLGALEAGQIQGPILAGIVFGVMGSFEATASIVRSVGRFSEAAGAAERLHAIATMAPSITEAQRPDPLPADNTLAFSHVHFAYPDGTKVLEGIDLEVAPGDHVAIVGISGAGKSTLANLLLRLNPVSRGAITIGGTDIRDVALADLHARVALLSQDSPVFLDTIRNNLAMARPQATDGELWAALRKARLEDTIRALPQGLDTLVGEAGTTLSSGQARRLCLARTLLSDAGIVVLDEPTQGLDRETELDFLSDLPRVLADRTLLLITHSALPEHTSLQRRILSHGQLLDARQ